MRLSDAIATGRTIVMPHAYTIFNSPKEGCALGMGLLGAGGHYSEAPFENPDNPYKQLTERWPWLESPCAAPCGCIEAQVNVFDVIGHIFDRHVIDDGSWTLDRLIDWVRSVEPSEAEETTEHAVSSRVSTEAAQVRR